MLRFLNTSRRGTNKKSCQSDFFLTDENFLQLERTLSKHLPWANDVWDRRVSLSLSLSFSAHSPNEKKFKYGIIPYLVWLWLQVFKAAPHRYKVNIPNAEYLIHIVGNVSIEVDTLIPVACELSRLGHSVVVIYGPSENIPKEIIERLPGIPAISFSHNEILSELADSFWNHIQCSIRSMIKAMVCLISLHGWVHAFWTHGTYFLHNLLLSCATEHFWSRILIESSFTGIGVASEFAVTASGLCRVARKRSWRIHHFLHGFPSIQETRGISTDIYCFSPAERDYFLKNGWKETSVHTVGHPRQYSLIQQIDNARTKFPNSAGLRLLFASQPPSSGGMEQAEYEQTILSVLTAANDLSLSPDEFRVRLHPIESRKKFSAIAATFGLPCQDSFFSCSQITNDLAWSNVVITVFSTMGIESAYAGSLLIWLSFGPFRYEVRENLIDRGYGLVATDSNQLKNILTACLSADSRSHLTANFLEKAKELAVLNPLSTNSIVNIMRN